MRLVSSKLSEDCFFCYHAKNFIIASTSRLDWMSHDSEEFFWSSWAFIRNEWKKFFRIWDWWIVFKYRVETKWNVGRILMIQIPLWKIFANSLSIKQLGIVYYLGIKFDLKLHNHRRKEKLFPTSPEWVFLSNLLFRFFPSHGLKESKLHKTFTNIMIL